MRQWLVPGEEGEAEIDSGAGGGACQDMGMRARFLAMVLMGLAAEAGAEEAVIQLQSVAESRTSEAAGGELRLWVRMQASGLQDALEYQDVRVEQAVDDAGKNLALPVDEDAEPVPSRLGRGEGEGAPSVLFPVVLKPSARGAKSIPEVRGSVTLRVFRRQVVLVEKVRERTGKTVEDALFKAHGLEVFVTDPVQGMPGLTEKTEMERLRERAVAVRVAGENIRAVEVDLVDGTGAVVPCRSSSFGGGRSVLFTLTADRPLAPDTQARVTLPTAPREAVVPFVLKNVLLP